MKFTLLIGLLVALQVSLAIHIQSLVGYIWKKTMVYFRGFIITSITNSMVGITLAIYVLMDREVLAGLNIDRILVLETGVLFAFMLGQKVRVTIQIIRRLRNPESYHVNHFGRKVYHGSIVEGKELAVYFLTMPFTLIAGAYFFAKLFYY